MLGQLMMNWPIFFIYCRNRRIINTSSSIALYKY